MKCMLKNTIIKSKELISVSHYRTYMQTKPLKVKYEKSYIMWGIVQLKI